MDMDQDPAFVADAQKLGLDVSPIDGEAVVKSSPKWPRPQRR